MKELTSSYDDLEKRMAIFAGLGAFLFTSFFLVTRGSDIFTLFIRSTLALFIFTVAGWAWGHYLRKLVKEHLDEEELPSNTVRESRDALAVEGQVVSASDFGETIIPGESGGAKADNFILPSFDAAPAPAQAPAAAPAQEDLGDLPPPPVPAGL